MAEMQDYTESMPPAEWAEVPGPGRGDAQRDELDRIVETLNELSAPISFDTLMNWRRDNRGSPPAGALSADAQRLANDARTQRIAGTDIAELLKDIDYVAVFAGPLSPLQLADVARNQNRRVSHNSYWLWVQRQRPPYDAQATGLAHVTLRRVYDTIGGGAPRFTTRIVFAQIRQQFVGRSGTDSGPRDSQRFSLRVTTMDTSSGSVVFRQRATPGLVHDGTGAARRKIAEDLLAFLVRQGVRKSYRDQPDMNRLDTVLQRFRRVMVPVSRAYYAPLGELANAPRANVQRSVFQKAADIGRIFRRAYRTTLDAVALRDNTVSQFLQEMERQSMLQARALPYQIDENYLQRLWLYVWYPQLELAVSREYEDGLSAQEDELTDSEETEVISLTESETPSDAEEDESEESEQVEEIEEDDTSSGSSSPFVQYACPYTLPASFSQSAIEIGRTGTKVVDLADSDSDDDEVAAPRVAPPTSPIRFSIFGNATPGDDYDSADETEVVEDVQEEEESPDPRYFRGMLEIRVVRKPDDHPSPSSVRYVYAWRYWALRKDMYVVQDSDKNAGWNDRGQPLVLRYDQQANYMVLYCGLGPDDPNLPVAVLDAPMLQFPPVDWVMRRNFYVLPDGTPSPNKAVLRSEQFQTNKFYLIVPSNTDTRTSGFRLVFATSS